MIGSTKITFKTFVDIFLLTERRCSARLSETSANFQDAELTPVNYVGRGACKMITKPDLGPEIYVVELRKGHMKQYVREKEKLAFHDDRSCLTAFFTEQSRILLFCRKETNG